MPTTSSKTRSTVVFMMHQITQLAVAEATEEFLDLGFTVQNARVMIVLLLNPGIRFGHLAEIACIGEPTLSLMLTRLAGRGMIVRDKVVGDNRGVTVRLTPEGRRLATGCRRSSIERERRLLSDLSPKEADAFRAGLAKIFSNATAVSERRESRRSAKAALARRPAARKAIR